MLQFNSEHFLKRVETPLTQRRFLRTSKYYLRKIAMLRIPQQFCFWSVAVRQNAQLDNSQNAKRQKKPTIFEQTRAEPKKTRLLVSGRSPECSDCF